MDSLIRERNGKDEIWFPEKLYNPNKVKIVGEVKKVKSVFDLM